MIIFYAIVYKIYYDVAINIIFKKYYITFLAFQLLHDYDIMHKKIFSNFNESA